MGKDGSANNRLPVQMADARGLLDERNSSLKEIATPHQDLAIHNMAPPAQPMV